MRRPAGPPARVAALFVLLSAACGEAPRPPLVPPAEAGASAMDEPVPLFTGGANQMEVTLFFLRADGETLAPEPRRIFRTATANDRARQAVQALLQGPERAMLPSVPPGTMLRDLFLTRDGTAFVDLSEEFRRGIEQGSSDAVTAVYAIVNTLTHNFPEVHKVKILVEGDEVDEVGGHISLARPLLPEMSLVSSEPPAARTHDGDAGPPLEKIP